MAGKNNSKSGESKAAVKKEKLEQQAGETQSTSVAKSTETVDETNADKEALKKLNALLQQEEAQTQQLKAAFETPSLKTAKLPPLREGQLRVYDKMLKRYVSDSAAVINSMLKFNPSRFTTE